MPQASNLYWMPLNSFIAALGMYLGEASYNTARWGFILLASFLAPLSYRLTQSFSQKKSHAWAVAWLLLFSGFYFPMWTAVDSFTPFALAGSLCLIALWQAIKHQDWRWAILSGLMAGLGHLSRADGLLLWLLAFVWLFFYSSPLINFLPQRT